MKGILAPGQRVQLEALPNLKRITEHIYQDTGNQMVYRIFSGEVVTVHSDLEYAELTELAYLDALHQVMKR